MHVGEFTKILIKTGDRNLCIQRVGRKQRVHKINVFRAPSLQGIK